jgi:hypothetical protein
LQQLYELPQDTGEESAVPIRLPLLAEKRFALVLALSTAAALVVSGCSSRLSDSEARDRLATTYSGSVRGGPVLGADGEVLGETGELVSGSDAGAGAGAGTDGATTAPRPW